MLNQQRKFIAASFGKSFFLGLFIFAAPLRALSPISPPAPGDSAQASPDKKFSLLSPDGNIGVTLELKSLPQPFLPGERAYYRVSYKGIPILSDSPLGLDFLGAPPLETDFDVLDAIWQSRDESWENAFGPRRNVRDRYIELTVSLKERQSPGRRVDLIFRA